MLKKIKNILGIEGVKMELRCPDQVDERQGFIEGQLTLKSKSPKTIKLITLKLIEKYQRGRNEDILIDEYLISSLEIETDLFLKDDIEKSIDFKLAFNLLKSDMDQLADKNILIKGIVGVAKSLKNVQSYYRLEAIANEDDSELDAVTKKKILIN